MSIKSILKEKIGLDWAIAWLLLGKASSLMKGPILIWVMIKYLSPEGQGLWYTFSNLSALSVLAELGFSQILTQFVSHEFAHLKEVDGKLYGTDLRLDRLFGLIRFSLKFYLTIIPIAIVILLFVGFFYFDKTFSPTLGAWSVFAIVGGFNLFVSLLQSIYQGLDKVSIVQKNITLLSVVTTLLNCLFLFFGLDIWSLVWGNLFATIAILLMLFRVSTNFWYQLVSHKSNNHFSFWNEILPLQWRYAISWASGFFIFNLITPSIYKFVGKVEAGQFGLTQSIVNMVLGVGYGWVFTKTPRFNILVSSNDTFKLLTLFKKSLFQGFIVQLLLSFAFLVVLYGLQVYDYYNSRFLSVFSTSLLLLHSLAQYFISAIAIYLRAHKKEPFAWISIVNALVVTILVYFVLIPESLNAFLFLNMLCLWLIILPLALLLFRRHLLML